VQDVEHLLTIPLMLQSHASAIEGLLSHGSDVDSSASAVLHCEVVLSWFSFKVRTARRAAERPVQSLNLNHKVL
jgi:hypothetical protein